MKSAEMSPYELAFQAESGDAGAQFRLGLLFLLGDKVEQDLEAAHRWMAEAARAGHSGAQILADRLAPYQISRTSAGVSRLVPLRFHKRSLLRALRAACSWAGSGIGNGFTSGISRARIAALGAASATRTKVSPMKTRQKPAPIVDAA